MRFFSLDKNVTKVGINQKWREGEKLIDASIYFGYFAISNCIRILILLDNKYRKPSETIQETFELMTFSSF